MSSKGHGELGRINGKNSVLYLARCALLASLAFLVGCGGGGGLDGSGFSSDRLPDRLPATDLAAAPEAAAPAAAPVGYADGQSLNCPRVVAWPNERLRTTYQNGHDGDQNFVIYRGEITKLSRECRFQGGRVVVKYGYAGRVLLGPKGYPGTFTLPVSVKVTDAYKAQIARDRMSVRVTIPGNQTVGYFSMVRQISFPVRSGTRIQDYKVFVALK